MNKLLTFILRHWWSNT